MNYQMGATLNLKKALFLGVEVLFFFLGLLRKFLSSYMASGFKRRFSCEWIFAQQPLAMVLLLAVTLVAFPGRAIAHDWSWWHWDRYASTVTINVYNTATYWNLANAARNDWDAKTLLSLPSVNYHTDISVFDGNSGDTGWVGLARIESYEGPGHITHGHAQLNFYYSYSDSYYQGVFCQEIGHLFGLDHSDTGDCMGLGYFPSATSYVGSHNINDIYNKYRYNHHVDLLMATVSGPSGGVAGSPIPISDTVCNQGTNSRMGTTDGFNVGFYLSTDATITTSDTPLLPSRSVGILGPGPGACSSGSTTVTIPSTVAARTYYLGAIADVGKAVPEANEANNARAGNTIAIGPDLVMTAVSGPSKGAAGSSITVSDTVLNQGAASTKVGFKVGFYLSTDATITTSDTPLLPSRSVTALAAGARSSGSTLVTIPSTVATGIYYLGAIADFGKVVPEANEANNALAGNTIAIGPDLVMTAVSGPSEGAAGSSITVSDTVLNQGAAGTKVGFNVGFYLSTDCTITTSDTPLLPSRPVTALAPGARSSGSTLVTIPIPSNMPAGTYYLGAIADPGTTIAETSEANNSLCGNPIRISNGTDLTVTSVGGSMNGAAGGNIIISDTVQNATIGGTLGFSIGYYLSTDNMITALDIFLGSRLVAPMAAGETNSGSATPVIPSSVAEGRYYLGAIADYTDTIPESSEGNNGLAATIPIFVSSGQHRLPTSTIQFDNAWNWNNCQNSDPARCVADPIGRPDEATYIHKGGNNGQYAIFGFSPFTVPTVVTVDYVRVTHVSRMRSNNRFPTLGAVLSVGGASYLSNTQSLTQDWITYTQDWMVNPQTGATWTVEDVNGSGSSPLQGVGVYSNEDDIDVTQLYITVAYHLFASCWSPVVITSSVTVLAPDQAKVNATINPANCPTAGWFEWGVTPSYGNTTISQAVGSGITPVSLSQQIGSLSPNTSYHFRVVAQNAVGTIYGEDVVFSTRYDSQDRVPTRDLSVRGAWDKVGCSGGDASACVDDPIGSPNNSVDYIRIRNRGPGYEAIFEVSPFTIPSGSTIQFVRVTYVAKADGGSADLNSAMQVNGTLYTQPTAQILSPDWAMYSYDWTSNPSTGAAWTVAEVNGSALQGMGLFSGNGDESVTQIYVTVGYQSQPPTTSQDRLPTGDLFVQGAWYTFGCGGSSAFVCVDDPIGSPNNGTDYIYIQNRGSGYRAIFGFSPFTIPSGANIQFVRVTYVATANSGSADVKAALQVNGVFYTQPTAQVLSSNWAMYSYTWTLNPRTGLAWTVAEVNGSALQGMGVVSGNGDESVTQVYVTVVY